MFQREATLELIRQIINDEYLSLAVESYEIREDVEAEGPCRVKVRLRHVDRNEREEIEGEGAGFVDALYHGVLAHYAQEFQSLDTIKFTGFSVTAKMNSSRDHKGADAIGVVSVKVNNSEDREFEFEQSGRSVVAAALAAVIEAMEFFINSEKAFITVYHAMLDARARGRVDLQQSFTHQLSRLVSTTSYTQVIERIKNEML